MVPLTVDGLIYASSMVMLDSARRKTPIPVLARWLLGLGIAATLAANVAHGLGRWPDRRGGGRMACSCAGCFVRTPNDGYPQFAGADGGHVQGLAADLRSFARARDWEQYHIPKNLAMALAGVR